MYFLLITFEVRELQENSLPLFVELNEMHIPTKFHAERRLLRGSKVLKNRYFPPSLIHIFQLFTNQDQPNQTLFSGETQNN